MEIRKFVQDNIKIWHKKLIVLECNENNPIYMFSKQVNHYYILHSINKIMKDEKTNFFKMHNKLYNNKV